MSDNRESTGKVGPGNPPLHTRFQPGQSGNPAGRSAGSKNISTIMRELLEVPKKVDDEGNTVNRLEYICAKLVRMAEEGDLASIDRVFDRLEGKPVQNGKTENVNTNVNVDAGKLSDMPDDKIEAAHKVLFGE